MQDPGSCTIPCIIGSYEFGESLCDSGASINLMPLSLLKRLSLGELFPTTMSLQMEDRFMAKQRESWRMYWSRWESLFFELTLLLLT